jgi:hypothetical protein
MRSFHGCSSISAPGCTDLYRGEFVRLAALRRSSAVVGGLAITLLGGFGASADGEPVPDAAWRLRRPATS